MQSICVFNFIMLCFLLIIYEADAADATANYNDYPDEPVADETINTDENNPVEDDDQDKNEPVNDENGNDVQDGVQNTNEQTNGVADDAEDDVPGANEPTEGEEKENEAQNDVSGDNSVQIQDAAKDAMIKNMDTFPKEGAAPLDKTYLVPSFNLSAAEKEKFKIWPDAKVPYFIDNLSYDKVLRDKIRGYLDHAHSRTNIDFHELFEPPTDENERWVFFVNRRGQLDCKDYSTKSFTNKGVQKVTVGYDCLKHGGHMAAIVLALLGVPPQHNSPDRDKFITIHEKNILPEKLIFFKKLNNDDWLFHDFPYDHISAGNYPSHKYTANGSPTVEIRYDTYEKRHPFQVVHDIVNAEEPKDYSPLDIHKIASLYNDIIFSKDKKRLKLEDCKALYKPGIGFVNKKLTTKKEIPERPKPVQYFSSPKKLQALNDIYGEQLSSLESY
ncbi:uncharacterized protein LOC125227597 [Leguminivora glycinivorella]|uniref:uncharacterized protein LOC125227597 n=1 Tax=Leguminivora glycinivorella TaxID=1035111 RepID=UPI00200D229D|nr:uncharacterized protein LOC125227597 [Leguminivora glycinivorella]